jgi:putative MATE family efflux protein
MWLSVGLMLIGRTGAEIGVSQNLGRGKPDAAQRFSQNAVFIAAVLGVALAAAFILFRHSLIGFFNIQDPAVALSTENYLAIVSIGLPFAYVNAAIVGSFNASGNSRTPFFANAVGLVINIVMDPVMIFVMDMGVMGAALATLIAQIINCGVCVYAISRTKNRPFAHYHFFTKPDGATLRQLFAWSGPIAVESTFFTLMAMITSRFEAGFGTNAMAAGRIGSQVESLTWLVGGGFGSALTAFMGQNFGAGKWTRIRRGFRLSLTIMMLYGATITLLLFFGGRLIFGVFLPDETVIGIGAIYLKIFAICQIFGCIETVAASTFRGIGRTLPPSVCSVSFNVIRVFLAYGLSQTSLGLYGVWLGISISSSLRGLVVFIWYLSGTRKQPNLDQTPA